MVEGQGKTEEKGENKHGNHAKEKSGLLSGVSQADETRRRDSLTGGRIPISETAKTDFE